MTRIRETYLWGDGPHCEEYLEEVATNLGKRIPGLSTVANGDIWDRVEPTDVASFAGRLAKARVFDLYKPLLAQDADPLPGDDEPLPGEVAYEQGRILGKNRSTGILYDGFRLSGTFGAIPDIGGALDTLHIVLTDRLVGTFDRSDRRYHARVVVFGHPHILSTTGVIEAPARPREFYLLRRQYGDAGMIPPEILESLRAEYVEPGDPRIGDILEGYALQCLFYQATGEPFCDDEDCCLFNAHWQAEMIRAQDESNGKLCKTHDEMLKSISGSGTA